MLLSQALLQVPVAENEDAAPEVPARAFRVVCDNMLQGLARSLRCVGADVLVLGAGEDHRRAAEVSVLGLCAHPPGARGLLGPCPLVAGPCLRLPGQRTGLPWVQGQRCLWLPGTWGLPPGTLSAPLACPHPQPLVLWALETLCRKRLCSRPRQGPACGDTSPRGHGENLSGGSQNSGVLNVGGSLPHRHMDTEPHTTHPPKCTVHWLSYTHSAVRPQPQPSEDVAVAARAPAPGGRGSVHIGALSWTAGHVHWAPAFRVHRRRGVLGLPSLW